MKTISLIVTRSAFDDIATGKKTVDYRQPSDFNNRLLGVLAPDGKYDPRTDIDSVIFYDGYSKDRRKIELVCEKIMVNHKVENGTQFTRIAIFLGLIKN